MPQLPIDDINIEYKTSIGKIYLNKKVEKGDIIQVKNDIGSPFFFYIESIKDDYLELDEYEPAIGEF